MAIDGDETIAVIDFETTGMTPAHGSRGTEIAAVLVRGGAVVGEFSSLMKSEVPIPPFIERLTGISNTMIAAAPPAAEVMASLADFTRGCAMVAHNASFDRGFWQHEMRLAGQAPDPAHRFACTVLLSRRLFEEAPGHRLGKLADWLGISFQGQAHRALADAQVTAQLLIRLQQRVAERFGAELAGLPVSHALLAELQMAKAGQLAKAVERHVRQQLLLRQARQQQVLPFEAMPSLTTPRHNPATA